ncbi:hypothetical protein [Cellulomonas soli]
MDRTTPAHGTQPEPDGTAGEPLTPAGATGPDESRLDPAEAGEGDDKDEERFDAG